MTVGVLRVKDTLELITLKDGYFVSSEFRIELPEIDRKVMTSITEEDALTFGEKVLEVTQAIGCIYYLGSVLLLYPNGIADLRNAVNVEHGFNKTFPYFLLNR